MPEIWKSFLKSGDFEISYKNIGRCGPLVVEFKNSIAYIMARLDSLVPTLKSQTTLFCTTLTPNYLFSVLVMQYSLCYTEGSGQVLEASLFPRPFEEEEKGPGTHCMCMHQLW